MGIVTRFCNGQLDRNHEDGTFVFKDSNCVNQAYDCRNSTKFGFVFFVMIYPIIKYQKWAR